MAEWSIAHPWKGCKRATVSGVRIPLSPLSKYHRLGGYFLSGERVSKLLCLRGDSKDGSMLLCNS